MQAVQIAQAPIEEQVKSNVRIKRDLLNEIKAKKKELDEALMQNDDYRRAELTIASSKETKRDVKAKLSKAEGKVKDLKAELRFMRRQLKSTNSSLSECLKDYVSTSGQMSFEGFEIEASYKLKNR